MKKSLPFVFLATVLLTALAFTPGWAATLTVNTLEDIDDGECDVIHCSLREAIHYANTGDTIDFSDTVSGTIELDGAQLTIDKSLTIQGPGEATLTISANTSSPNKQSRVFFVYSDANDLEVAISGLSISNGDADNDLGAGIYNDGEKLTLINCIVSDNSTRSGGGGIYNTGTLTMSHSTLMNNAATGGPGGGIYNDGTLIVNSSTISGNSAVGGAGGGAFNTGTMSIENSTFFDNHADGNRWWGGGIANIGTLSLNFSTLSANSAEHYGGGLCHRGDSLTLANTMIANNVGGDCNSDTPITDGGYNLIEGSDNDACGLSSGTNGNITGTDPLIVDSLGDYGGPTLTLAIQFPTSPTVDAIPGGVNGCIAGNSLDQRGEVRAGGTDGTGYIACDIGAFEYASGKIPTIYTQFLPHVSTE